jgi:hypothetical protein
MAENKTDAPSAPAPGKPGVFVATTSSSVFLQSIDSDSPPASA